jgi:hypothetical protein
VRLASLVGLLVLLAACAGAHTEREYAARVPEPLRASYEVFAQRCSKCHSVARPLDSGIDDDEHWARYVDRMRRQQGSGISVADVQPILEFLRYYAAEQRQRRAAGGR